MNFKNVLLSLVLCTLSISSYAKKSEWKFRVFNSYSVTNSKLEKTPLGDLPNQEELRNNVKKAILDHSFEEDRNSYIQDMCAGYNEREKIEMGRYLSELSSEIYDYDRSQAATFDYGEVVTNQQQWMALKSVLHPDTARIRKGVCRDMTSNVAEFLLNCGIPKDCIKIESFRTNQGGHQVVQAGCQDLYTINWSELYTTNNEDAVNHDLNPNILNTGIEHTTFDPETGEIIGMRQTELGAVLASVSGGEVEDPNYIPKLLMLEAQYSVMTLGLFKSELRRGDKLMGVKAELEANPTKWMHLGAGLTYARNTLEANSIGSHSKMSQEIVYANFRGRIDLPAVKIFDVMGNQIFLENSGMANGEFSYSNNEIYGESHWNQDGRFTFNTNTVIRVTRNNHSVYFSQTPRYGINSRAYNNEVADTYRNGQHFAGFQDSMRYSAGYQYNGVGTKYGGEISSEEYHYGDRVRAQVNFDDPYHRVKVLLGASQFTDLRKKKYMSYDASLGKTFQLKSGKINTQLRALYTPDNLDKYQMHMSFEYIPN